LFLHALPLDGSMWAGQSVLRPGATYMPTLYPAGDTVQLWAEWALKQAKEERLIVVGCSVGGSCALEVAAMEPGRVAALVLIGTKANRRPNPQMLALVLETIERQGLEAAWKTFWAPLFSKTANPSVVDAAKAMFLRQSAKDIAKGVTAFHTRPSRGDILSAFSGSVTVISGEEDIAPGPEVSAAQARSARQGRFVCIPDCGHYVPLEKPGRLNEILRDVISMQDDLL
jgi:pimeloyl-[acyl-carrier protein] methyl ester esterase